jgi:Ca2+-binding RTX toxin-like protein
LRIHADELEDQAAIVRVGQTIRVTDDVTGLVQTCAGGDPTVHNIDFIVFFVDADGAGIFISLAGGRLAPGASPERSATPEIEVRIGTVVNALPGNIGVGGSRKADGISVRTGDGVGLIDLNRDQDGDADVSFDRRIVGVLIRGGKGADLLSGSGITRARGPSLSVYAGPGNDRIFGGAAGDILYGRAGRDVIAGRSGADEIDCGPGNDVARTDARDHVVRCESRRAERPFALL